MSIYELNRLTSRNNKIFIMKLTILKSSILMLTIAAMIPSCKKETVNEVKINGLSSFTAEFKTPSAEYTTAPFFVWN